MSDGLPPIDRIDLRFRAEPVRIRSSWLPGSVWIWFSLGIVAGILGWHFGQQKLASQLGQRVQPESNPGEALVALDALELLGTEDSALYVQGLSHPDARVARSAFEKLNILISQWPSLESSLHYAKLRVLAEQLDRVPQELAEEQAALVRSLAAALYSTCIAVNDPQLQSTANRCLGMLRLESTKENWKNLVELTSADRRLPPVQPIEPTNTPETGQKSSPIDLGLTIGDSRAAEVPANRPVRLVETQAVRSSNSLRLNDQTQDNSPPIYASMDGQSQGSAETANPMPVSPQPVVHRLISQDLSTEQTIPPNSMRSAEPPPELPVMVRTPASIASHPVVRMKLISDKPDLAGIEKAENAELIKLLGNAHADVAKAAALALKHRGFRDSEIELASELAVAKPERRIEIIQQIAQSSQMAPQPWLLWMAEEGEPEVRRMAISLLSSMQNEQVQRTLRMLLFREKNQELQDLIRKVLLSGAPGWQSGG